MTFRAKLLLSYFALVAAVELITIFVLDRSLASDLVARLDERLAMQAKSSAVWVGARRELHRSEQGTGDRQAIRLAGVLRAWVMIFDAHGKVIGDSERLSGIDLPYTELEPSYPEVAEARAGELGRATRISKRHGEEMYYVAVAGDRGLVVRLAVPLAEVTATISTMRLRLLAASLFAFVVAVILGLFAARIVAEPQRAMTRSASQLAHGNYDIEVAVPSTPDEIGALGRALATLGSDLKARIGDLTRERDRLSAILETMVEGVLVIGWGQELVIVNPSAAAILSSDEKIASLLAETIAKGEASQVEIESAARSLVINVRPLAKTAGGGAVAVLHDVTQLRRLENMRREFVANASHELRTPVAAIRGYAETLLRGVDPKTQAEFLEVIDRHARRIGRLVEDLLRLSELEARGAEKVTHQPVQVAGVAANVEETMRERISARRMSLSIQAEPGVEALAGEDELEQVLTNLVDNAIKYGREGGRITVRARRDRGRTIIEVEDDGPGIGEEHLPKIFERFYRVDPARSRAFGGSGLGLSIVRRLVESMNGSISVESEVGKGARFVVQLP